MKESHNKNMAATELSGREIEIKMEVLEEQHVITTHMIST